MDDSLGSLVVAAQAGDANAFALLIERHERTLLALAFGMLQDAEAAGDAAQETFIRAWRKLGSLKEPQRFSGWLAGILRNVAMDHRRRNGRHTPQPLDGLMIPEMRPDPLAAASQREMDQRLASAIASLDELTRMAVLLRYYEGLGSREIASLLELTPAAVDMRLSRARAQMRGWLEPGLAQPTRTSNSAVET